MYVKVLIIGLDGATFDLIKPWTAQGKLPTFKMLMENGVYSDLVSTIPPSSPPAWTSFMTGKNLGKHGIFDFVGRSDNYSVKLKNSRDIKAKTLWRLLSEEDKTCIVVNVPMTYPPEKIKGCIVTGMMTPPNVCYVYPSVIYQALKEIGYTPGTNVKKTFSTEKVRDYLTTVSFKRLKSVLFLMEKINWDFCIVVFSGTDAIQHQLWQYHKGTILQYYKEIDAIVKELIDKTRNETNIVLMSDHGFGPEYRFFHVNYFLHRLGLLEFREEKHSGEYLTKKDYRFTKTKLQRTLLKLGITKETVYTTSMKLHIIWLLQKIYKKFYVQVPTTKKSIDWKRTKAFYNSTIGPAPSIGINLDGRQPKGIVKKGEYSELMEFIISELLKVKDTETGRKIVQDVFRREDIYHGPYVSEAPDITFLTNNLEYAATDRIYQNSLVSEPVHTGRGTHRMNGIFIAYGSDIKSIGEELKKARIIDLAPTILHMFDLKIPKDMDGKVLAHIFKPNSQIAKRPITYNKITEKERIRARIRRLKKLRQYH